MTNSVATPATINQRNSEFWNAQIQLLEQRAADPKLLEQAISNLDSESVRAVPIYNRMTFEAALEEAVQAKERFHTRVARQGGKAAKTDRLGLRIQQLAMQHPTIHINELWHQLRKEVGNGLIVAIDPDSNEPGCVRKIHYHTGDGKIKTAPMSGLKHRLARAKAKLGLAS
jgi:hypothetical protein